MKNLIFTLAFLIAGCASTPLELINEINSVPDSQIYKSEISLLESNPSAKSITDNQVEFEFNKNTPLLLINGKRSPFRVAQLVNEGSLLEVSTVIQSAGWRKDAFVLPKISFSKSNSIIPAPKVKDTKFDGLCGLNACLVTTYDLSTIPKGAYKIILSAYVENINSPLEFRKVSGFYYTGEGIPLPITAERAQYATYYGTVKMRLLGNH